MEDEQNHDEESKNQVIDPNILQITNQTDQNALEKEINQQEIFKTATKDDTFFVEESPEIALTKLLSLNADTNATEILAYAHHIGDIAFLNGKSIIPHLDTILTQLLSLKNEEVKRVVLEQMGVLVAILNEFIIGKQLSHQEYLTIIQKVLLRHLEDTLRNEKLDLKTMACELMHLVANDMSNEDRGKYILPIIIELAHDDIDEENRMISIKLMSSLAELFGLELCENFVGFELLHLGEDRSARVRIECISHLDAVARAVSIEFTHQRFVDFFVKMTSDTKNLKIACMDVLFKFAKVVSEEVRQEKLKEILLRSLKDLNKNVKTAAYKSLGPFISTLSQVDESLVQFYVNMIDTNVSCNDQEILIACSYNFPAVLLTVGPTKWNLLRPTYFALADSRDWKVRRPLAYSLHEVAKILGPEITEMELTPLLKEKFLCDPIEDVKYGVIEHLTEFITIFEENRRGPFIELLDQILKEQNKWRFRELIAQQLDKWAKLFDIEITFKDILPKCLALCRDRVAIVRNVASRNIWSLVTRICESGKNNYLNELLGQIKAFAGEPTYFLRQAFLEMCKGIIQHYPDKYIVEEFLAPLMSELSEDKTVNVRITLASVLCHHNRAKGQFLANPHLNQITAVLNKDKDLDVKRVLNEARKSASPRSKASSQSLSPPRTPSIGSPFQTMRTVDRSIITPLSALRAYARTEDMKQEEPKMSEGLMKPEAPRSTLRLQEMVNEEINESLNVEARQPTMTMALTPDIYGTRMQEEDPILHFEEEKLPGSQPGSKIPPSNTIMYNNLETKQEGMNNNLFGPNNTVTNSKENFQAPQDTNYIPTVNLMSHTGS